MEASILKSVKKVLNLPSDYTAFDEDVLLHMNSAFSTLSQLGVGPSGGITVDSDTITWDELSLPPDQLNMVRTYIYLKTKLLFDPPGTSFHLDAMNEQIDEQEWRLSALRDEAIAAELEEIG